MKTPIRTYKTAELYMQQGYFEEAREVLQALEAENSSDSKLPELYQKLEELIKEAEINPPVQQLERDEEYGSENINIPSIQPAASQNTKQSQPQSCCTVAPVEHRKYTPTTKSSRTQRLVNAAADIGIDVAQRAVTGLVKGLNHVITRIQERKGGL